MDSILREKRQFQRWDWRLPLQYRRLERFDDHPKGSITKNLGEEGLKFVTNEFITATQRLELKLLLPASKIVTTVSKVVWVRKAPYGHRYEVGTQFVEIAHQDRKQLVDFIGEYSR